MSVKHQDTYFLDAKTALKVALQANEVNTSSENVKGLQVCYYEAEQPLKDAPQNCIFVPLDNVYNYFVTTKNRFPNEVNFDNTEFSQDERELLNTSIHQILYKSRVERAELIDILMKQVKELKPDFSDKKLRVFVPACRETTVIKNISENIAKTFEKMGYDVCFFIQDNAMQGCVDILPYIHTLHEFNPHIIVNINHLNNEYLNDEVFNFVWFQDMMPVLLNNDKIKQRKRDVIFHLTEAIELQLHKKNIQSTYQGFCIDNNVYKLRPEIKRENKIVFIGSSYKAYLPDIEPRDELLREMKSYFLEKGAITSDRISLYADKYKQSKNNIIFFYNYIVRDILVLELCKLSLNIKIEIYGYGFDVYPELKPYYKGELSFGEEVSKVYNSAKYCFAPGGYVFQQRVIEACTSGAIPVIPYNQMLNNDFEKSVIFFKTLKDLKNNLEQDKTLNKNLELLAHGHTYSDFMNQCLQFIEE